MNDEAVRIMAQSNKFRAFNDTQIQSNNESNLEQYHPIRSQLRLINNYTRMCNGLIL